MLECEPFVVSAASDYIGCLSMPSAPCSTYYDADQGCVQEPAAGMFLTCSSGVLCHRLFCRRHVRKRCYAWYVRLRVSVHEPSVAQDTCYKP